MRKFFDNKILVICILLALCCLLTFLIFHVSGSKSSGIYSKAMVDKYIEKLGNVDTLVWRESDVTVSDEDVENEIKSILKANNQDKLTDEFVQKISDVKTVTEYKKEVKQTLQKNKEVSVVEGAKQGLLYTILDETVFKVDKDGNILLPEDEVERLCDKRLEEYKQYAKDSNMSIEDFCKSNLGKSFDDVKEELKNSVKGTVKFNLVVSALVHKYDIKVTDKDMKAFADTYLKNVGMTEETFETQYKKSFIKYYGEDDLRNYLYQDAVMNKLVEVAKANSKSKKNKG